MIVVAAVIAREGQILACQRSRKSRFALKWEFPGGKVQPDETPEAALKRELMEELAVRAEIGREIYRTRHKYAEMPDSVELIFFEARVESGKIQNRVFEKIDWVEPKMLKELDFLEADKELIRKLAAGEIYISRETRAGKSASD